MVKQYFANGYPYEPHLSAMHSDLDDLRTMRNASAHISSTTQAALEALFLRIFGAPSAGIALYNLLTSVDPRSTNGATVFVTYKKKTTCDCRTNFDRIGLNEPNVGGRLTSLFRVGQVKC